MNSNTQESETTITSSASDSASASASAPSVTDSALLPSSPSGDAHEDDPPAEPLPSPADTVMSSRDPDALYSGGGIRFLIFPFKCLYGSLCFRWNLLSDY